MQELLQPGWCQSLSWPHRTVLGVRAEKTGSGNSEGIIWDLTLFVVWFPPPLQFSSAHAIEQKRLFLNKDGELKVSHDWFHPRGLNLCCGICNGFPVCPEMG